MVNITFEQDYIMRLINELIRFLAKVFLNKEIVTYEFSHEEKYTQIDNLHKQLLILIEQGKINEAENMLYERMDLKDKKYIELALDFYERLNNLDDEYLEKNNFSRKEVEQGLKGIAKELGVSV